MRNNKYHLIITKRKIKTLIFLLFALAIPAILSTPLFTSFNNNFQEFDENDTFDEQNIPLKLSAPPNAHYFTNYKTITIDHNKVAGSGYSNFPVLISILDSDLRYDVQSDGDDIAFSSENIWLDHEIELFDQTYSPTQAKLVAWVRLPVLSGTIDTIIRMYYGNSTMSSRQNPTGVWSSIYKAVWHMNQNPFTSNILDSTSNNYDLTTTGFTSDTRFYDGKVGTAISVDGINDYFYINSIDGPINDITFQAWFTPDNTIENVTSQMDFFRGNSPTRGHPTMRFITSGSVNVYLEVTTDDSEGSYGIKNSWAGGSWFQFTYTRSISLSRATHYIDGTQDVVDTSSDNASPHLAWNRFSILAYYDGTRIWGPGAISEFRILSFPLSAGWIATEYNNQNDPNSFYTVGSEQIVAWTPPNDHYFTYYKIITIDHNKVAGTGSHTNFPVLISLIDENLRYHAQPDGDDIAFSMGGDWLNHEIELFDQSYNTTHAQLVAWVRVPYLSTTTNTIITMYYGNSTMASRENPEGVWESNYKAVYHLHDDFLDSTTNNRDGVNTGSVDATGRIGDGQDFEHDDGSDNIYIGTWSISGSAITIQAWVKYESFDSVWSGYSDARILSKNSGGGDDNEAHVWMLGTYNQSLDENGPYFLRGRIKTGTDDLTGTTIVEATSGPLSINTWYLTTIRYDGSNIYLILDGNTVLTQSKTGFLRENNWPITIGNSPTGNRPIDATIDEVRVSSTLRSNDWIQTEYNNQYDPSSFYSIGGEQLVADVPPNVDYFEYYKIITIDHNMVIGTGSHSNFPLLISLFDEDLRYDVQYDGDDIAFAMDGKWLDHQIELFNQTYSSTQAKLIAWVRVPFLSTAFDTNITMYYCNSTMSSRQNPTGVWGEYQAVWHLSESTGSGYYIKDSTSNGYDGTPYGTQFLTTGQVDGARKFSGSGDNRISINRGLEFFDGDNSFSYSFWIYPNYASDAEWEALERRVFMKEGSVRLSRIYRNSLWSARVGRYQADIQFETYGTIYPNVVIYRKTWTYITYCYDGNYFRAYTNGTLQGSPINIGGFSLISSTNSFYLGREFDSFIGYLDEFRVSNIAKSGEWIATEYNNQDDPYSFYSVGSEQNLVPLIYVDAQINAVDLYGNSLPNVSISMYQYSNLIGTGFTDVNGSIEFTEIPQGEYNFTATIGSNIGNVTELVNITSQAIVLDQLFQVVNLTCNVSPNFFEVVDIDGMPLESGWIIVGNSTEDLQKCIIDATGHTSFWWVNIIPYNYNYTIYYQNDLYAYPNSILPLTSGDITTPNSVVPVQVDMTSINFTVLSSSPPNDPITGAKLILRRINILGESIVNLTTDSDGKATLRWLNSSGINGNYSLQIEFFGRPRRFNITVGMPPQVNETSFTVKNKDSIEFRIEINLDELRTELISLNPIDYIVVKWGTEVKLRALFNVSRVDNPLYNYLLGPRYADSMTYRVLLGSTPVQSGSFLKEEGNEGRHHVTIDTTYLESGITYVITVSAVKSGYTIPDNLILQLNILKNELELNYTENEDSDISVYWLEPATMTLESYGKNSESFTIQSTIFQNQDHEFNFSIPNIENHWNLSSITFNLYNITWNTDISHINITIEDPDGAFYYAFNSTTHGGWDYNQRTWTGIILDLNTASPTNNNSFEFIIKGTYDGTVDIIAEAKFIRDSLNVQYSKFNISDTISILGEVEGWAIRNITFAISNCYNTSTWTKVDLTELTSLNITTNEGFTYSLDYGDGNGNGILTIDDRVIYPLGNQLLFSVESAPDVIFNVIIKVEYIQEFYKNQYLETLNLTIIDSDILYGEIFEISAAENSWMDTGAILWVEGIKAGSTYYYPSEVAMNITIGQTLYTISDYSLAKGIFLLTGFPKDQNLNASITTDRLVNFTLKLSLGYSRIVSYEIIGDVSYKIVEAPSVYGTAQYDIDLGYYLQAIDTSLLKAKRYTLRCTITKNHFNSDELDFKLIVLKRPTLLNGSVDFFRSFEQVYAMEAVNFTFIYSDNLTYQPITNVQQQSFIWEKYNEQGQVIGTGSGDLIAVGTSFVLDLNTELFTLGEYLVVVTLEKDNYDYKNGMITLDILERPTLINGFSELPLIQTEIYIGQEYNFTFSYVDSIGNVNITNLNNQSYSWKRFDSEDFIVESGQGTLTFNVNNLYVLDFDTETRNIGRYELIVTLTKENYTSKSTTILLTIELRTFDYSLSQNFRNYQISVVKGKVIPIEINITDLTQNNISLTSAVVLLKIRNIDYLFEEISNGTYKLMFSTNNIDAFFSSRTLRGIINISKEGYNSMEFSITIVVEMEVLFLGIPTFYFILAMSIIGTFMGSIVAYRIYRYTVIPTFVKKVRDMKKAIEKGKDISESLLYRKKDVFIGERVKNKWDKVELSYAKIFGIKLKKETVERIISEAVIRREQKPNGLILMKWDEKIGTRVLAKYPDDVEVSEKTLLQIYGTHEYTGEKGVVNLTVGTTNILSYYTGPDQSFYLLLFLNLDDDPDLYEDGMANTISTILENLKDDSYLRMIPYLFQRLSLYPSLNDEEILTLHYQDEIKRFIIKVLEEDGVIIKSELSLWLRDKGLIGVTDLDAILLELTKKDIIKQISIKGLPSVLIVLTNDIFMLRVPPVNLLENPVSRGLPTQFAKIYLAEVKKFFQDYRPIEEDNLKIIEIFTNPEAYETLRLLRTAIVTRNELEKLSKKGVKDIYGVLKIFWDNQMIKVFKDENNNEYFALLSDFYMDLIFPKYILEIIKKSYEQKSKANKVLIEYLNILEESYLNLKKQKK